MAEWSAAVAAAAFVVLTAAVIVALRSLLARINRFERSVRTIEEQSAAVMQELRELASEASGTVQKVSRQLDRADGLFEAAGRLGESMQQTAAAVTRVTTAIDRTAAAHVERSIKANRERIGDALDWAEAGWTAWRWWQAKRESASTVPVRQHDDMHDQD